MYSYIYIFSYIHTLIRGVFAPSPTRCAHERLQQTLGVSAGEFPCEAEPETVVSEAVTASARILRP